MGVLNFNERPILVFWESTRACLLACKHCRAEAIEKPAEGELSTSEGKNLIDQLTVFGRPYPVLIITGGDALMRPDVFDLVHYARSKQVPIGLAPSVTPRLTEENIQTMARLGVKAVSISLDGAKPSTHERIRGIPGHFEETVKQLRRLVDAGFEVQVNTAVMKDNVSELPALVQLMKQTGVKIWEVFYLIHVGRGKESAELTANECEDVGHFLFEASTYDLIVRTVKAPFFRRIVTERREYYQGMTESSQDVAEHFQLGALYQKLSGELRNRLNLPASASKAQTSHTRDGKGIIFVAYDGTVYPAGFLPLPLGNVRTDRLVDIYRDNPVLKDIRNSQFGGKCGRCSYRDMCGGSRSRAFAHYHDPLGEDPSCNYDPSSSIKVMV